MRKVVLNILKYKDGVFFMAYDLDGQVYDSGDLNYLFENKRNYSVYRKTKDGIVKISSYLDIQYECNI